MVLRWRLRSPVGACGDPTLVTDAFDCLDAESHGVGSYRACSGRLYGERQADRSEGREGRRRVTTSRLTLPCVSASQGDAKAQQPMLSIREIKVIYLAAEL